MSNAAKTSPAPITRSAAFGLAEHVWRTDLSRWTLRIRKKRIAALLAILLVLLYFAAATLKYAENKWSRDCAKTSYFEICLFIFPDRIPFTSTVWTPGFIHRICENARASHRAKLADVLLEKAKKDMADRQWSKFFQGIFGATKLNPQNNEARLLAAQALFALRRDDDAMASLEESLPDLLTNKEFVREYIITSFIKERYSRLLSVAKYHLANPSIPPEAREAFLIASAHCRFERGEFEELTKLISNPAIARTKDAFLLRVRMLKELGKNTEALALLSAAAAQNTTDTDIALQRISLLKEMGDHGGAREVAALHMIHATDSPSVRLRMMETLDSVADKERIETLISGYRRDFAKKPTAALPLCEYAAGNGNSALCEELWKEAEENKNPDAQRMRLLFIESHLTGRHYQETLRLVDSLFIENPPWLAQMRLQFDSLRMVAHFALGREDTGEIGLKRIYESTENLQPRFMDIVARRLIEIGRFNEAIRVVELSHSRNSDSSASLAVLIAIHFQAGGTPETPDRLREYLEYRRPTRKILQTARRVIGGDAYFFDPRRDRLIKDIESLLEGKPVVEEVEALAPPSAEGK